MKYKSLAFAIFSIATVASSISFIAPIAQAGVNVNLEIGIPPPEPRVEYAPDPREGFVWIQGFWGWDGHRHVWNEGHWEHERRGYAYRPAHWDHEGDRWRFREGYWEGRKEERREEHHEHHGHDEGHRDRDDR